ncbi:family 43 glycosylhydrolase [Candidatus Nomurabacteria bacterium]|nr:family 43 glycosylhydrolase [Candidatus Nomurabacteria bacterium]
MQRSPDNSTWTTFLTFPNWSHPYIPRYHFLDTAVSPGAAYRYYRVSSGGSPVTFGELEFVGNAGEPSSGSRPVEPVVTPAGGVALYGSVTINMSSLTTSATMHYTVDGSTPTCSSTTYSSPFTLTVGTATVVKAVACDATLTTQASLVTTSGTFRNYGIKPADTSWSDVSGYPNFHSGSIILVNGQYYYFTQWEESYNHGSDLTNNSGIEIYKSSDLLNWTWVQEVPTPSAPTNWYYVERPHVLYNSSTSKYVMWAHCTQTHDANDRACIWTANDPSSTWTLQTATLNPTEGGTGYGFKDFNLFQESDGNAYVVYTSGTPNNADNWIAKLTSDYLNVTGTDYLHLNAGVSREAPVLFKRGSAYFLITSASNYYNFNATFDVQYQTNIGASPLANSWSALNTNYFYTSDPIGTANNAQPTAVLNLGGDNWLYLADHWLSTDLQHSTRVWYMLRFPTGTTIAPPNPLPAQWDIPRPQRRMM